jgi:hypothetical protein
VPAARRRRLAVTAVVAVVIAALVAVGLTLGPDIFGGHPGGRPQALAGGGTAPGSVTRTGGTAATPASHRSARATATSRHAAPTAGTSGARTGQPTGPWPSSATSAPAPAHAPATAASALGSRSSSPASSPPVTSSTGELSATNATTYTCGDHPIAGATSTSASYQWVNNTSGAVYIYYTETSFYAGSTGSVPANSSVGSTVAVGGTYLVENAAGGCLGAVKLNATTGTITIS